MSLEVKALKLREDLSRRAQLASAFTEKSTL